MKRACLPFLDRHLPRWRRRRLLGGGDATAAVAAALGEGAWRGRTPRQRRADRCRTAPCGGTPGTLAASLPWHAQSGRAGAMALASLASDAPGAYLGRRLGGGAPAVELCAAIVTRGAHPRQGLGAHRQGRSPLQADASTALDSAPGHFGPAAADAPQPSRSRPGQRPARPSRSGRLALPDAGGDPAGRGDASAVWRSAAMAFCVRSLVPIGRRSR